MFTDDLFREGGRVPQSSLSFDSKYHIILAKKHQLSKLLIKEIHIRFCHSREELSLNLLKELFWIIHAKWGRIVKLQLLKVKKNFYGATFNE